MHDDDDVNDDLGNDYIDNNVVVVDDARVVNADIHIVDDDVDDVNDGGDDIVLIVVDGVVDYVSDDVVVVACVVGVPFLGGRGVGCKRCAKVPFASPPSFLNPCTSYNLPLVTPSPPKRNACHASYCCCRYL